MPTYTIRRTSKRKKTEPSLSTLLEGNRRTFNALCILKGHKGVALDDPITLTHRGLKNG